MASLRRDLKQLAFPIPQELVRRVVERSMVPTASCSSGLGVAEATPFSPTYAHRETR